MEETASGRCIERFGNFDPESSGLILKLRLPVRECRNRPASPTKMSASQKFQRCVLTCVVSLWTAAAHAEDDFSFFEAKVRPVLVEHCYKCHSAKSEKIKGGLRLDEKEAVLKGGDSGPAIVAGKPEDSLLIKAIRYTDEDLQMPPQKGGGRKLPDAVINDLIAWVKMGAPDPRVDSVSAAKPNPPSPYDFVAARTNWAFHAPADPSVPKTRDRAWPKSAIDSFILAKLEEKQLSPAPPADRRTLIRRATFDLTGLPPTPEEIDNFLADQSTNAFAKVVERLLASPSYGERWARHWLDVVRYTDSLDARVVGTDQDSIDAWRYRDWVVNAFNGDLPYDQFITRQVAGDLLPPPEPEGIDTNAIIATGMYAIGNWGNGDADKDKILTDIADDAVDVTGRAFLGLTLACARCHDHKFDPIPTADYYSLAGIFFSSHILPKLTPKGAGEAHFQGRRRAPKTARNPHGRVGTNHRQNPGRADCRNCKKGKTGNQALPDCGCGFPKPAQPVGSRSGDKT